MHTAADIRQITDNVPTVDILGVESFLVLPLIQKLCTALVMENIAYCHWKSNDVLERSASGDNDLDLLVSRADAARFSGILYRLGFKLAKAPKEREMPAVLDYFGYDEEADRLIHVHAHYHLILGDDMTKNYRLPIEKPYLESAVQGELFRVPAIDIEFIVFIIRMVLKHSTWDAIPARQGKMKASERRELAYLQARISLERVHSVLKQHLPYIPVELFNACIRSLEPSCSTWTRVKTGHRLQVQLQANARRPLVDDIALKLWRRVKSAIRRRVFKSSPKYCLSSGGALLAIVGGDGAGKSTAVEGLNAWLSKHFEVTSVHMGKPAWSFTTKTVRGILKIGNILALYPVDSSFRKTLNQKSVVSPGYPWLLREVCKARDRYWTYVKARRLAAKGALVLVDRFPLPQIKLMDGPQTERFVGQLMSGPGADGALRPHQDSQLVQNLINIEENYYNQIVLPELLMALRVNPEIAIVRKTDEDPISVRERSTEIWELDWAYSNAHIVDGSKSKTDVLAELKALIWSEL